MQNYAVEKIPSRAGRKKIGILLAAALCVAVPSTEALATAVTASRANDADDLANNAVFDNLGAWTLSVADNDNFGNGVITTAGNGGANAGTATFLGTSIVNTAAGADAIGTSTNALLAINAGAAGETVTFNGDVFATTLNVTGTGTVNADSITAGNIRYMGDGTISVDHTENITSAITTDTDGTGTLTLEGTTTVSGQIGTAQAALKEIKRQGVVRTVHFSNAVYTDLLSISSTGGTCFIDAGFGSADFTTGVLNFSGAATQMTLADNANFYGTIVNTLGSVSQLLAFSGSSYVSGQVGGPGLTAINSISFSGAGETVVFGGDVYTAIWTQAAANTIDIGSHAINASNTFTMDANGTLALTVNSASSFGHVEVGNATTLAATNVIDVRVAGGLANGTKLAIITSGSGVAAAPSTVTDNSALLSFTASEPSAGDVVLTTAMNTAAIPLSENGSSILSSIDTALSLGIGGEFTSAVGALYALSSGRAVADALETLDPTSNGGSVIVSHDATQLHAGTVVGHLAELRGAAPSSGGTGIATGDFWTQAGFWIKGFGNHADQDSRSGVNGYEAGTWGTSAGIDRSMREGFRLGLAGGYARSNVKNKGEAGGADIDGYQGSIYADFDSGPWNFSVLTTHAWNRYDSSRRILLGGTQLTADSDADGWQHGILLDGGYAIPLGGPWTLTPLGSLDYAHLSIDPYAETGAGTLNLRVDRQQYDFLELGLGARLDYTLRTERGSWTPEIHAKWLYDGVGDRIQNTSRFSAGGPAFTTNGLEPAQSALNAGAGITFYFRDGLSVSATYDFIHKADFLSHNGELTCRYDF